MVSLSPAQTLQQILALTPLTCGIMGRGLHFFLDEAGEMGKQRVLGICQAVHLPGAVSPVHPAGLFILTVLLLAHRNALGGSSPLLQLCSLGQKPQVPSQGSVCLGHQERAGQGSSRLGPLGMDLVHGGGPRFVPDPVPGAGSQPVRLWVLRRSGSAEI